MSPMNMMANLPNWGYYFLQQQNMNKIMVKTISSVTSNSIDDDPVNISEKDVREKIPEEPKINDID
jgi:hypothetical protein